MARNEGWVFYRRSWRRHPVLAAIQLACSIGFAVIGVLDLIVGHDDWLRGGISLVLWIASFVLLVMLVRRDEPEESSGPANLDG